MVTLEQNAWHIVRAQEIVVAFNTQGQCAYSGHALKDGEELGKRGQEINAQCLKLINQETSGKKCYSRPRRLSLESYKKRS